MNFNLKKYFLINLKLKPIIVLIRESVISNERRKPTRKLLKNNYLIRNGGKTFGLKVAKKENQRARKNLKKSL
jgi:hypothetical protein